VIDRGNAFGGKGNECKEEMRVIDACNLFHSFLNVLLYDNAIELFERVLTFRRAKLGEKHPETLMSMADLAGGFVHHGFCKLSFCNFTHPGCRAQFLSSACGPKKKKKKEKKRRGSERMRSKATIETRMPSEARVE
jgi:hypothetical protein